LHRQQIGGFGSRVIKSPLLRCRVGSANDADSVDESPKQRVALLSDEFTGVSKSADDDRTALLFLPHLASDINGVLRQLDSNVKLRCLLALSQTTVPRNNKMQIILTVV
jgi:hypothetical protein